MKHTRDWRCSRCGDYIAQQFERMELQVGPPKTQQPAPNRLMGARINHEGDAV